MTRDEAIAAKTDTNARSDWAFIVPLVALFAIMCIGAFMFFLYNLV